MKTEFEFIRSIKETYGLNHVGDDCAVLPNDSKTDLLVTADLLVEDVDFRLDWTTPELLGHKALAVSLSDIAAMGGTPKWSMLSIGVPQKIWKTKFLDQLYDGWHALARTYGVELVGGDVSRTPEKVVIDSIVGGEVRKGRAILRSGARVGDSIFVTGSLGGAAGGLSLLETGERFPKTRGSKRRLCERQLRPNPRLDLSRTVSRDRLATAMIDISDGLAADLYHICDASGVGASLDLQALPIDRDLETFFSREKQIEFALGGGEDFELLFTSRRGEATIENLQPVTKIGEVTSNVGTVAIVIDRKKKLLRRSGYRHF